MFVLGSGGAPALGSCARPPGATDEPAVFDRRLLLGSAVVIYLACEFFVNGVEWMGRKLAVGQTATGTILAAFGTALPESVVTFVAVAFGTTPAQRRSASGRRWAGRWCWRRSPMPGGRDAARLPPEAAADRGVGADFKRLSRDQGWFLAIFVVKLGLGLVAFAWKPWLGVVFLAAYGAYFWREMREASDGEEDRARAAEFAPRHAIRRRPGPRADGHGAGGDLPRLARCSSASSTRWARPWG